MPPARWSILFPLSLLQPQHCGSLLADCCLATRDAVVDIWRDCDAPLRTEIVSKLSCPVAWQWVGGEDCKGFLG